MDGEKSSLNGLAEAVADYVAPTVPACLRQYADVAREIRGWLQPEVLTVVGVLADLYRRAGVRGGSVEIGVHHGLFYIALAKALRGEGRGVAIDVFGDQHLNPDGSGHGDLAMFRGNMERMGLSLARHKILQRDSMTVTPEEIRSAMDGEPILLFSVDGAHTAEYTASDLTLAAQSIHDWGVIVVDDLFNGRWPGVIDGVLKWLRSGSGLGFEMVAYGNNKGFLAKSETASILRPLLAHRMLARADEVVFADKPSFFCRFKSLQELESPGRPLPALRRGEQYGFSSGGPGVPYLDAGWSKPDPSGVWSKAAEAALRLPAETLRGEPTITLGVKGFGPVSEPNQVDVFIGARKICTQDLGGAEAELRLPFPDLGEAPFVDLVFRFAHVYSPAALGMSTDTRELAMRLQWLRLD